MRQDDLLKRLDDRTFRPFRIHLDDGSVLSVTEPGMMIVGGSTAVLPTRFGVTSEGRRFARDWQTVALLHMVRFTDLRPRRGNGTPRGRQGR